MRLRRGEEFCWVGYVDNVGWRLERGEEFCWVGYVVDVGWREGRNFTGLDM